MHSARAAIAWEIWRKNAWGLATLLLALFTFGLAEVGLAAWWRTPNARLLDHPWVLAHESLAGWIILTAFMVMAASLLALSVMCCYTEPGAGGLEEFPSRMYALPVTTSRLAGWPMGLGMLAMIMLYAAWAGLIFRPLGITLPLGLPLLSLAAGSGALQAAAWGFPTHRAIKLPVIALIFLLVLALDAWEFSAVKVHQIILPGLENLMPEWSDRSVMLYNQIALGLAAALAVAAYPVAISAIERQRHGRPVRWPAWTSRFDASAQEPSRPLRPLRSPEAAQFWFEWRRNGRILPSCILVAMALMLGPVPWVTGMDNESIARCLFILFVLPMVLAALVGKGFAKLDLWSRDFSLPVFLAVRPLRPDVLVFAKLKAAAVSVMAAWALVIALVPLWVVLWGAGNTLTKLGNAARGDYSMLSIGFIIVLSLAAAVVLTWAFMAGSVFAGVWGRPLIFLGWVLSSMFGYVSLVYFGTWLLAGWESPYHVLISLPWILRFMGLAFLVKIWVAVWAFQAGHRQGLISARAIRNYLAIWAAATVLLAALSILLFPYSAWTRHLLVMGACFVVPLARVALAPLALAANRKCR